MIAKVVVFAFAIAGALAHYGGVSESARKQDDHGNYEFKYQIVDHKGATNGRYETGSAHGPVVGSYNLGDIDGRSRRVDYVADKAGFRAVVKTNEPGTAASHPAAAEIASPYHGNFAGSYKVAHVVPAHGYGGYGALGGYGGYGYDGGYGYGGYGAGHGAGYGAGYGGGYGAGYGGAYGAGYGGYGYH